MEHWARWSGQRRLQRKVRASMSYFWARTPIEYVKMEESFLEILEKTCYKEIHVVNIP